MTNVISAVFPFPMYPVITGTLDIQSAIVHSILGMNELAKEKMCEACSLLRPDGITYPFAEFMMFYNKKLLQVLKEYYPEFESRMKTDWELNVNNRLSLQNMLSKTDRIARLSRQELRMAIFVSHGLTNKEISARMDISPGTVKSTLTNIFNKLNISSRKEIATYVIHPIDQPI